MSDELLPGRVDADVANSVKALLEDLYHSRTLEGPYLSAWHGDYLAEARALLEEGKMAVVLAIETANELRAEHMQPRLENPVCLGVTSDPYQPSEERLMVTREILWEGQPSDDYYDL